MSLVSDRTRFAWPARANSLTVRLVGWFFAAAVVLVVSVSAVFYWATSSGLQWADDELLDKRLKNIRSLVQAATPDGDAIDHEVSEELEGPRQILIRVVLPPDRVIHETPGMSDFIPVTKFPSLAASNIDAPLNADITGSDGRSFRTVAARVASSPKLGSAEAVIQIATDISLDLQVLSWYRTLLVVVVGICVAASALAGWTIIRRELRGLRTITAATSRIGSANLSYRLPLAGLPIELNDLGSQFNDMLERLQTAYESLRQYADDVAHELRTPLNKMLLGSEIILRKARTLEEYKEALESNVEECESLTKLVRGLLFVARAENAQMTLEREPVDLLHEMEHIRTYFEGSAIDAGVEIAVDCQPDIRLSLDRLMFQRAISNLVANALSHTPRGGRVCMSAQATGGGAVVSVSDSGEGIPTEHQPRIFDRFYRVDNARAASGDRVGLGLAITKSIVELHGGVIKLKSAPGAGTTFELTFPQA